MLCATLRKGGYHALGDTEVWLPWTHLFHLRPHPFWEQRAELPPPCPGARAGCRLSWGWGLEWSRGQVPLGNENIGTCVCSAQRHMPACESQLGSSMLLNTIALRYVSTENKNMFVSRDSSRRGQGEWEPNTIVACLLKMKLF